MYVFPSPCQHVSAHHCFHHCNSIMRSVVCVNVYTIFTFFLVTKSELIQAEIKAPNGSFLENILHQPITKTFISYVQETWGSNLSYSTDYIRNQWQIDMECKIEGNKASIIENKQSILSSNNDRDHFKISLVLPSVLKWIQKLALKHILSRFVRTTLGRGRTQMQTTNNRAGSVRWHLLWYGMWVEAGRGQSDRNKQIQVALAEMKFKKKQAKNWKQNQKHREDMRVKAGTKART